MTTKVGADEREPRRPHSDLQTVDGHASIEERGGSDTQQPVATQSASDPMAPQWRPLIVGLLMALVMATIMVTTYVQSQHGVVAHNLPWGEVGTSPLTAQVQKNVSLELHSYPSVSAMEQAARETKIYGGFVASTNTILISEASSLWAPGAMPAAYLKAAKAQGVKLGIPTVVNKLPEQDPEGVVPGLVTFVLLVAGYLGATLAMQRTKRAAAHRRVLVFAGYALVAGLVFDLIVGPILGAYRPAA